ncbi:DUF1593 domain-containing protein [Lacihabitans lacunae]|uniref:Nucleoside hydrolase-like domain-containing protein n=1 Tax=Lacihabitans lacunae TaxID=1028214 RepID=A0ABV7Z1M7_9BACT
MKALFTLFFLSVFLVISACKDTAAVQTEDSINSTSIKPRIITTTDLGADPDDEQSLVRELVSANEFDIEGLIVATGCWKKTQSNTTILDKILNAYSLAYPNLKVHSNAYPSPEYLRSISSIGQRGYGMADVGTGKDSPGSNLIIAAADKNDARPIWIMGWGGMNTVAQAIWKVKETRNATQLKDFLSKLRLYDVLGQDDAGAWIAKNYPEVFYIRATSVYGWQPTDEYLAASIQNKGPLGAVYPNRKYATEGDTPSFMHVFPNGLNNPEQVEQGGWGGRFNTTKTAGIRSMSEVKKIQEDAETQYDPYMMHGNTAEGAEAIKRWAIGYNNDFTARMLWSVTSDYTKANHHPIAVLNGDATKQVLEMTASPGAVIELNTSGSKDPDNNKLNYSWVYYKEPSSYSGVVSIQNSTSTLAKIEIPKDAAGQTLHFVLEVYDNGTPSLYAYRRMIVKVQAAK